MGKAEPLERELVRVVSVPRSAFEQGPMGHELLRSKLGPAGSSGRGRVRFGTAGLVHRPRRLICDWGRGKTLHRAKLKSERSVAQTQTGMARAQGKDAGVLCLAWFVLVGQHGAGGGGGEFAESATLLSWKKNYSCPLPALHANPGYSFQKCPYIC